MQDAQLTKLLRQLRWAVQVGGFRDIPEALLYLSEQMVKDSYSVTGSLRKRLRKRAALFARAARMIQ